MKSLRRQLTLRLLGLCALLWLGAGGGLYAVLRAALAAEFDVALLARAQALATLVKQEANGVELDFAGEIMRDFERTHSPDYFQIWKSDGTTLARSSSLHGATLPCRVDPIEAPVYGNLSLPDGRDGRAIGLQFVPQSDEELREHGIRPRTPSAAVTLVVAAHREDLDRHLRLLLTTLLAAGGMLALLTMLLVPPCVRRGLVPVDELAQRVAAVDATALQARFPIAGLPAELLPVAERLNELMGRLETAFARERRFSADVAHELRTPIAELRALAEVSLQWPDDHEAAVRALNEALAISLQMESIATRLLTLARCEAGTQPIRYESVPTALFLSGIWKPLEATARERQLHFVWNLPPDFSLSTDPALLRAILENLLENAVAYSPPGSAITVSGSGSSGNWQLDISNPAGDLMAEDIPHLFERFWRKDPARSSATHCGLGLALAQAYARLLHLELLATLSPAAMLTLTLRPHTLEENG